MCGGKDETVAVGLWGWLVRPGVSSERVKRLVAPVVLFILTVCAFLMFQYRDQQVPMISYYISLLGSVWYVLTSATNSVCCCACPQSIGTFLSFSLLAKYIHDKE
eukprot:Hpha_TRINITY_DN28686_c0_g1::TRINITY_DN28686_c0_g1_i1::g.156437::m.156437